MPTTLHPPRPRIPGRELVLPSVAVAFALVEPWRLRGRLPDPIAIHWGLDGLPDGSAPFVVDAVLMVAATALVALMPLYAAASADRRAARWLVGIGQSAAVFFLLLRQRTLALNLDAEEWAAAGPLTLVDLAVLLLLAAPAVAVGWWLGGTHPDRQRPVRAPAKVVLPADAAVAWVGRQTWPVGRILGPLLIVAGALLAGVRVTPEGVLIGASMAFAGFLVWGLTSIVVAVGPTGLRVRFGPLGWPGVRVPLTEITGVGLEDVEPMAYGGWGYRVMPGIRAIVIRRGEGLRIGRSGRADLIVTVDDAATAGAVLAAHLAGPGSARGSRGTTE
jgi:hypothetical protein